MSLTSLLESMQTTLGESLPSLLGALAILVLGWFIAILVRAAVKKSLSFVKVNEFIRRATESKVDVESAVAKVIYYIVLLLVLIGFFSALRLPMVSEPLRSLVDQVFAYVPRLAAAAALAFVAWILAMLLRKLATKALAATTLDEKLSKEAGMRPFSESLGNVLYWLVILLFLPGILGALGLEGLLGPVQGMVDKALAIAPNLLAATAIGLVGWFVAKLLRDLVANLLAAAGADNLGRKAGLGEKASLSKLAGLVVYIFVLVPAVIAALDALKIDAISRPATEMLGAVMNAIPNIFGAAIILALTYVAARFAAGLASNILTGVGFNELPKALGLGAVFRGETTPAAFIGKLLVFFAMVFATVEAANRLGFGQVSELVATFIDFAGQVLLGGVIILVGLWISSLVFRAISGFETSNAVLFAGVARFAILGLVFAMGLRAMGIADSIVNLAFGLTLGAIAVAVALSFGLGGREAAGRQMEHWLSRLRGER